MKKVLALVLVLALSLPAVALADAVLADGWQNATIDELKQAQTDIANRISELRAAEAGSIERVELTGSGTSILSDVVIPFAPSRVIITGDVSAKLTGGKYDYTFDARDGYNATFFDASGTYGLLVEGAGDWSFVVEPIADGGTLPMEGVGPFVSDFFELPSPMIVAVSGDASGMDAMMSNFIVSLHNQFKNIDMWSSDSLTNELLTGKSEPINADLILQPVEGRTQYCISVKCSPGVAWSIAVK